MFQKSFSHRGNYKEELHTVEDENSIDETSREITNSIQIPIVNKNESQEGLDSKSNEGSKCEYCNESFPQDDDLKKHTQTFHGQSDYIYKSYGKSGTLKKHHCNYCGKSFSEKGTLSNHIHTIHKDHKCDTCGKSFTRLHSLPIGETSTYS